MDTTNFSSASATALPNGGDNKIKGIVKTVATAVTGAVIGNVFPIKIGKAKESISEIQPKETITEEPTPSVKWADNDISVASDVNNEMSFNEAFATARAEVGAGGAFEWRGNVYGTYYAEEWDSMTPSEKADFNNHFNWDKLDTTANDDTPSAAITTEDDVEIISVDDTNVPVNDDVASNVEVISAEPEIEILGVVHDESTGSNFGGISVDGQNVYLIDVDGDLEFDLMASDINCNDAVDENEIVDIQGLGMSVHEFGGISGITESISGEDANTDYMADNTFEI